MPYQATNRDIVAGSPLFADVDPAALADIQAMAIPRSLAPEALLLEQGNAATHLHVVATGCLKLTHVTPSGAQIVLGYAERGRVIGCMGLLRPMQNPISAKAVEESLVLSWTAAQVDALFSAHPLMLRNALRHICGMADALLERLRELTTENAEQRIARALHRLVASGDAAAGRRTPPLSRQDLAEMTGSTHFTVSRILSGWESEGLIQSKRPRVWVRDLDRLTRIAEGNVAASLRPRSPRSLQGQAAEHHSER